MTIAWSLPTAIAASLRDLVRAGFTSFNFMLVGDTGTQQTEQLAAEVIPALRALNDR